MGAWSRLASRTSIGRLQNQINIVRRRYRLQFEANNRSWIIGPCVAALTLAITAQLSYPTMAIALGAGVMVKFR